MDAAPDTARTAALLADATRMSFLDELAARGPQSIGALARLGGVSASVASQHVARLAAGGLVTVTPVGRMRVVAIASAEVADALEALSRIAPPKKVQSLREVRRAEAFRVARSCYDHLAGRLGVDLLEAMRECGWLLPAGSEAAGFLGLLDLSAEGEKACSALGLDAAPLRRVRRAFARGCLDCTERRPHLGGALGALMLSTLLARGWLVPGQGRALRLAEEGRRALALWLGREPVMPYASQATVGVRKGRTGTGGSASG
jgi:DNA-binding transcriptional ArsR family regulator